MAVQPAIVAVLAGGRGERLGGRKPAAVLAGRPLVCHPLQAAADAGLESVVVAKPDTPLPPLGGVVLLEPDGRRHPLAGVVAALRFAARGRHSSVLVVGCDMPFVTAPMLRFMASLAGPVACRVQGRVQPLPARVPVGGLSLLEQALDDGSSLRSAFVELSPRLLDEEDLARFGDPARLCLSVNDPADLQAAAEWLEGRGA